MNKDDMTDDEWWRTYNDAYWNKKIERHEGRREGIETRNIKIASNMLKETNDLEFISRVTSLPINEIKNLQNKES